INERMKALEAFITLSFSLIVLVYLSRFPFSSYISNTYILFFITVILLILMVIVSLYVGINIANIIFFWIFGQRENLLKLKELKWKYKNILKYIVIILVILLLDFAKFSTWGQSAAVLILYRICQIIFDKK
ncbi:MAG: hypothetical protein Q8M92_05005, partial [Candidatus Subteraquimicrobiales bacterium]|nr:hypothetical protein [Candidatus Subteraquimicrobiales bacterium]